MKVHDLPGRARIALALLILFVAVAAAWSIVVAPIVSAFERQAHTIGQSQEHLIRMRREARAIVALQSKVEALTQAVDTAPAYHRGETVERLVAEVQQRFMTMASRDGTQVRSLRAMPAPDEVSGQTILLRARLVISLSALVELLDAIEAHRPKLVIEFVEIRATSGPGATAVPVTVSGPMGPVLGVDLRLALAAVIGAS